MTNKKLCEMYYQEGYARAIEDILKMIDELPWYKKAKVSVEVIQGFLKQKIEGLNETR